MMNRRRALLAAVGCLLTFAVPHAKAATAQGSFT
jgi:hypothetical protein